MALNPTDYVGVSFWVISAAMLAATYFFYVERDRAKLCLLSPYSSLPGDAGFP